jgi:hypothetical protein
LKNLNESILNRLKYQSGVHPSGASNSNTLTKERSIENQLNEEIAVLTHMQRQLSAENHSKSGSLGLMLKENAFISETALSPLVNTTLCTIKDNDLTMSSSTSETESSVQRMNERRKNGPKQLQKSSLYKKETIEKCYACARKICKSNENDTCKSCKVIAANSHVQNPSIYKQGKFLNESPSAAAPMFSPVSVTDIYQGQNSNSLGIHMRNKIDKPLLISELTHNSFAPNDGKIDGKTLSKENIKYDQIRSMEYDGNSIVELMKRVGYEENVTDKLFMADNKSHDEVSFGNSDKLLYLEIKKAMEDLILM